MHKDMKHPAPAVGAIILRDDEILMIKRGTQPGMGRWSVPGGSVELGETLHEAVRREVMEETGLDVVVGQIAGVCDMIVRDDDSILFHYVLIDYFATAHPAEAVAATDAAECRWVKLADLGQYDVTETLMDRLKEHGLVRFPGLSSSASSAGESTGTSDRRRSGRLRGRPSRPGN